MIPRPIPSHDKAGTGDTGPRFVMAEICARRRKIFQFVFGRHMCVDENASQSASVEFGRDG